MSPRRETAVRGTGGSGLLLALASLAAITAFTSPGYGGSQTILPQGFTDRLVVGGLDLPVGMAFLPDGRLLVVEQRTARIRLVVNGALAAIDPVTTVPLVRSDGFERGLLGIAVDPGFPARPYVYVHCNDSSAFVVRISRFTVAGDLPFSGNGALTIDPASRYDVIASIPDATDRHNGGTLRFGPDGMLYASFGEDGAGCAAQDTSGLRGVILRLDVSNLPSGGGGPPPLDLITPPGNPFAAGSPKARLLWAFGLRNPFRFGIDPVDGTLYIGDVGQLTWEELNRAGVGGLDFGWSRYEGPAVFNAQCALTLSATGPIYAYDRTGLPKASVISAGVYRSPPGATRPFPAEYEGDVFLSDYFEGFVRRLKGSGDTWSIAPQVPGQPGFTNWAFGMWGVSDYAVGPDGSLWFCKQYVDPFAPTGEIRCLEWAGNAGAPDAAGGGPVSFSPPFPSPAAGVVHFAYSLSAPAEVELALYDLHGRLVRRVLGPVREVAGGHRQSWDGRDDSGARAPAGLYFARLTAGRTIVLQRVAWTP